MKAAKLNLLLSRLPLRLVLSMTLTDPFIPQLNSSDSVTARARILEVGQAGELLRTRSLILRKAGYAVTEETDLKRARKIAYSANIDAVVLCHSLSDKETQRLVKALRQLRPLLPIICLVLNETNEVPPGCCKTLASPNELLGVLEEMFQKPAATRIFRENSSRRGKNPANPSA